MEITHNVTPEHHNPLAAFMLAAKDLVRERLEFYEAINSSIMFEQLNSRQLKLLESGPLQFRELYRQHVGINPVEG